MKKVNQLQFIAFVFMAMLFLALVKLGMLGMLLAGLLSFAMVTGLSSRLVKAGQDSTRSDLIASSVVAFSVIFILVGAGIGIAYGLKNAGDINVLLLKMSAILGDAKTVLPESISGLIPEKDTLLHKISEWLKEHASMLGTASAVTLKSFGLILLGVLIGAMVGVSEFNRKSSMGPISTLLLYQIDQLRDCFWRIVSAQIKISSLNAALTAVYLLVILPVLDIDLPLRKTMILITFLAGLLPVIGNLISNAIIVVISLSVSFNVAIGSLTFLVVVHKLEYFLNAKIVGAQINAKAWEILLVMILMERLFGVAGVISAPVLYAWLKSEWNKWDEQTETSETAQNITLPSPG